MGYGGWDDPLDFNDPGYDDPYIGWGGGAGGDGSYGSGDSGSAYDNWGGGQGGDGSEIFHGGADGTGMGWGTTPDADWMSMIAKGLGLGGKGSLLPLLGMIAALGGGINQNRAIKNATGQLQDAANNANQFAIDNIMPALQNYKPYQEAGTTALGNMQAMAGKPLVVEKISVGTPSTLANKYSGMMTLAQLAKGR